MLRTELDQTCDNNNIRPHRTCGRPDGNIGGSCIIYLSRCRTMRNQNTQLCFWYVSPASSVECQATFRRNLSPPSSRLNIKPSKRPVLRKQQGGAENHGLPCKPERFAASPESLKDSQRPLKSSKIHGFPRKPQRFTAPPESLKNSRRPPKASKMHGVL
jgi:hypothetical protein